MTKKRDRGRGPLAVASALVVGLLISGFTVWSATEAAFTATAATTADQWHTGTITIGDNDDEATAMFASTAKQTFTTTPASNVFTCGANWTSTGTLWDPVADGTLYPFPTTKSDWAGGLGTGWTPAPGEHRAFRFLTEIRSNAPQTSDLTGIPFTWEVQR